MFLVGKLNVDECRDCLDSTSVLSYIKKVPMAALEERIPLDNIELNTMACFSGPILCEVASWE